MRFLVLSAAVCGLMTFVAPAMAQEDVGSPSSDTAYLGLSIGDYDIFHNNDAADFRLDYTFADAFFWKLKPYVGVEATDDGSLWGGGGVKADFMLAPNIYLTPSLGAGLYAQGDSDKDLGHVIEFRTQLEGGYQFQNGHRLGLSFSHISNAGLDDTNPGTEVLGITYQIPVGNLF